VIHERKGVTMSKTAAIPALACLVFVLTTHGGSATTKAATACPSVPARGEIPAASLPANVSATACGLVGRIVRHNKVGARVQKPGMAIFAEALGDKVTSTLHMTTRVDGRLAIEYETSSASRAQSGRGPNRRASGTTRTLQTHTTDNGCSDSFLPDISHHESDYFRWRFNAANTPTNLTTEGVIAATTAGSRHLETNNTNCPVTDQDAFDQNYDGLTAFTPNITLEGDCTDNDDINVVGWRFMNDSGDGDSGAGTLATACTWATGFPSYEVVESDILFDSDDPWFITGPANCGYTFDIESVMTHERGHTVGMEHPDEDAHHWMTMSPLVDPCDVSQRTLTLGEANYMNMGY
jgi:hypothetical protein